VAMRAQPSSSAYLKKNKVESLVQFDKLEKNDIDTSKDKKLAFAVFRYAHTALPNHALKWASPFFGLAHPPPFRSRKSVLKKVKNG